MASVTLTTWSNEVPVINDTSAAITVQATNTDTSVDVIIPAYSASFVGIQGQRPDALNQPGSGGFDSGQGLGAGYGLTVQTLTGTEVTVTPSSGTPQLQPDGSVLVS